jgi:hypothetical protein
MTPDPYATAAELGLMFGERADVRVIERERFIEASVDAEMGGGPSHVAGEQREAGPAIQCHPFQPETKQSN